MYKAITFSALRFARDSVFAIVMIPVHWFIIAAAGLYGSLVAANKVLNVNYRIFKEEVKLWRLLNEKESEINSVAGESDCRKED